MKEPRPQKSLLSPLDKVDCCMWEKTLPELKFEFSYQQKMDGIFILFL